eukprot:28208-Chlamydomonas_euryale.AAC.1
MGASETEAKLAWLLEAAPCIDPSHPRVQEHSRQVGVRASAQLPACPSVACLAAWCLLAWLAAWLPACLLAWLPGRLVPACLSVVLPASLLGCPGS